MTTIYYEAGLPAALIPVQFLGWKKTPAHEITQGFNAQIRLKRKGPGYERGEVLNVPPWSVVVKAGYRGYHMRVRNAPLPVRTPENTLT